MFETIKKLRLYNPYSDLLMYFTPVFIIFMFGYYSGDASIENVIRLASIFNSFINTISIILIFVVLGKILFEITGFITHFFHVVLHWFKWLFYKITKNMSSESVKSLRVSIKNSAIRSDHIKEEKLLAILYDNDVLRSWHVRSKITAHAFQTGIGALVVGFFLFQESRLFMLLSLIVIIILETRAKKHLNHVEEVIDATIVKK